MKCGKRIMKVQYITTLKHFYHYRNKLELYIMTAAEKLRMEIMQEVPFKKRN